MHKFVEMLKAAEEMSTKEEEEPDVSHEHLNDLPGAASLGNEGAGGATHSPGTLSARKNKVAADHKLQPDRRPRFRSFTFDSVTQAPDVEHMGQGSVVTARVLGVPADAVAIVGVGAEKR